MFSVEARIGVFRKRRSQSSTASQRSSKGREVPASALDAHDPEPSLRGVESESAPYGETLQHLVRTEGLLTEHAGRVHGGLERADSEEFGEYVPQLVQLFEAVTLLGPAFLCQRVHRVSRQISSQRRGRALVEQ